MRKKKRSFYGQKNTEYPPLIQCYKLYNHYSPPRHETIKIKNRELKITCTKKRTGRLQIIITYMAVEPSFSSNIKVKFSPPRRWLAALKAAARRALSPFSKSMSNRSSKSCPSSLCDESIVS